MLPYQLSIGYHQKHVTNLLLFPQSTLPDMKHIPIF